MSNIFKFSRRTNSGGPSLIAWSTKAIGDGDVVNGYKAGTIKNGSNIQYSLIVCPRANGQATTADLQKVFNTTNGTIPTALSTLGNGNTVPLLMYSGKYYGSLWDGLSNTNALYSASSINYDAVNYCKSLTTGGYNDWYLPAKDELELICRSFKPITAGNYTGGAYVGGNNASSVPQFNQSNTSSVPSQTGFVKFQTGGTENLVPALYLTSNLISTTKVWCINSGNLACDHNGTTASVHVRPVRRSQL